MDFTRNLPLSFKINVSLVDSSTELFLLHLQIFYKKTDSPLFTIVSFLKRKYFWGFFLRRTSKFEKLSTSLILNLKIKTEYLTCWIFLGIVVIPSPKQL